MKNKEAVVSPRTRAYSASKKVNLAKPMKKGGTSTTIPKGYHKMPDGTIMKNSSHKSKKSK